jgi:predicted nucleic acid-binding protein
MQGILVPPVDEAVAHRAAGIGTRLRIQGQPLNTVDQQIAATAFVHGLTVVTHAPQAYANIPGLTVVDWMVP